MTEQPPPQTKSVHKVFAFIAVIAFAAALFFILTKGIACSGSCVDGILDLSWTFVSGIPATQRICILSHDFCGGYSSVILPCSIHGIQWIQTLRADHSLDSSDHVWNGNIDEHKRFCIRSQITQSSIDRCMRPSLSSCPFLGFTLAKSSGFPPEIAAGIILIGCSPSGLASNVMSYLAKANLALSITITSITTLMAPFMTPLLMNLLAGEFIEIDMYKMMWDIIKMIMIPIGAGLLFNRLFHGKSAWLDKAMPIVSMVGIGLIIVIITAAGRDSLLENRVAAHTACIDS